MTEPRLPADTDPDHVAPVVPGAPEVPAPAAERAGRGALWGLIGIALATVAAIVWAWPHAGDTRLSIPEAILLGIVEGVTEFLPISSTGHLTVTNALLGLDATESSKAASDAYAIAIQAGAIVAVLGLYRRRVGNALLSVAGRGADPEAGRRLLVATVVAFLPAAIVGVITKDLITEYLFGIWPVVAAWFVGGVVILMWPAIREGGRPLELITWRDGVIIGAIQVIAMWPGVSRSLVVILGALLVGLSLAAAVEFAFLLGLVTLGAATVYEAMKSGGDIVHQFGVAAPIVGFIAAFVSAAASVVWMVDFVQRRGLRVFGWYRIGVAAVVAVLALTVLH